MIPINQVGIPQKVTVTSTAQDIETLLGVTLPAKYTDGSTNIYRTAVEVYADGGDVRYTRNPQHTPSETSGNGFVLKDGETRIFQGLNFKNLKFQATTNTTLQVEVGRV